VIFAIREQHQHAMILLRLFIERAPRCIDRFSDRRPALRNNPRLKYLHTLPERFIIKRQRTLQKCAPRKRHQTKSIKLPQLQ
jgi:hypothetical protein